MLPGLMRTAATPASIAFSASDALKWMSAITGSGEKRTIRGSASASSSFGTATRTISQPAEASAAICAVVASTSCVFVERHRLDDDGRSAADRDVADPDLPLAGHWCQSSQAASRDPGLSGSLRLDLRRPAAEVVRERDERQQQDQPEADDGDALVDLAGDGAAPDPLDEREEDVAAVERQERQEVQERERHAHEADDLEVVAEADLQRLLGDAHDADGARQLAAFLLVEEGAERVHRSGGDLPAVVRGEPGAVAERIRDALASPARSPRSSGRRSSAIVVCGPSVTRRSPRRTVTVIGLPWLDADQLRDARRTSPSCVPFTATTRSPALEAGGRRRACSARPAPTRVVAVPVGAPVA